MVRQISWITDLPMVCAVSCMYQRERCMVRVELQRKPLTALLSEKQIADMLIPHFRVRAIRHPNVRQKPYVRHIRINMEQMWLLHVHVTPTDHISLPLIIEYMHSLSAMCCVARI